MLTKVNRSEIYIKQEIEDKITEMLKIEHIRKNI